MQFYNIEWTQLWPASQLTKFSVVFFQGDFTEKPPNHLLNRLPHGATCFHSCCALSKIPPKVSSSLQNPQRLNMVRKFTLRPPSYRWAAPTPSLPTPTTLGQLNVEFVTKIHNGSCLLSQFNCTSYTISNAETIPSVYPRGVYIPAAICTVVLPV